MPVWAELLADLETPVAAYVKLVGDEPGFLLESVEHGERWSRFSFVGRDPVATLVLRDGRVDVDGPLPVAVPTDRGDPGGDGGDAGGVPRAGDRRAAAAARRADGIPRLRRRAGGRATAEPAPDDRHLPDAVLSMIGSLAAFDHWRQRVTLIESVPVLGLDSAGLDAAYDAAVASIERGVANLARPLPYLPVEPPSPDDVLPEVKSSMPDGLYQQAVEVAKEHIVAGDIFQVVLAQRYDLQLDAEPFDVYRVLRQVNPSPYMYFVRHPGADDRRLVARADGPGARRRRTGRGWSPARSPARASGAPPTSTIGASPPS